MTDDVTPDDTRPDATTDGSRPNAPQVARVLDRTAVRSLAEYESAGGGTGLRLARDVDPDTVVRTVTDAGLRGRGGAGFPTGTKWSTVAEHRGPHGAPQVVVNAAEGEPGSFKDRTLLRTNPYRVLEGALIAAHAVGAGGVVVAMKASFSAEIERVDRAIDELGRAGWSGPSPIRIALGPSHYLFGEETALLEVVDGRPPFPRVTPPFRRGLGDDERTAAGVQLATEDAGTGAPAALVNNVETLANVPDIVSRGPEWFRELGTAESPGTVLVTVTGRTRRHGVAEVPMGTPLDVAIEAIGGGPRAGRAITAALSGVSNPVVLADRLDTPLSYEAMSAIGSGLGAAGYIVLDDATAPTDVAHGVSRFLAVESCGQCEPCKRDGLAIAAHLRDALAGGLEADERSDLDARLDTVPDGRRCFLAQQHHDVVRSLLDASWSTVPDGDDAEPVRILPIVDISNGEALLDLDHLDKQPDWSHDDEDSGTWPADTVTEVRLGSSPGRVAETAEAGPDSTAAVGGRPDPADARPYALIVERERHIEALLDDVTSADRERRAEARRAVLDAVRHHVDLVQRVLVPLVARSAGEAGDDAAFVAERRSRHLAGVVDELVDRTGADDWSAARDDIVELRHVVDGLVLPLLRSTLDAEGQGALGEAVDELAAS